MEVARILDEFRYLTDMYMVDYFVESQWNKLPESWRRFFDSIEGNPEEFIDFIKYILRNPEDKRKIKTPPPLSLLSLRSLVYFHSIPFYRPVETKAQLQEHLRVVTTSNDDFTDITKVMDSTQRTKIKFKKAHEIGRIVDLIKILIGTTVGESRIEEIVDIGAGLGHLSRILSILTECKVRTIEGNDKLVSRAMEIDSRISRRHQDTMPEREVAFIREESEITSDLFFNKLLIGVHTCGDLSPTLIRNFVSDSSAKILLHFGCCHHKLNGGLDKPFREDFSGAEGDNSGVKTGFPLSRRYAKVKLSYAARELACFSVDQFVSKMTPTGEEYYVNGYRAVLEYLFVVVCGRVEWRHRRTRGVKNANQMDFWEYASLAVKGDEGALQLLEEAKSQPDVQSLITQKLLEARKRMPFIYSLRLLIAPLCETLIYLDRQNYLQENSISTMFVPLFKPEISPRNVALVSIKK